jgi:hypothetical protein
VNPNKKNLFACTRPGKIVLPGKTINNTTTTIQTMLFAMVNLLESRVEASAILYYFSFIISSPKPE